MFNFTFSAEWFTLRRMAIFSLAMVSLSGGFGVRASAQANGSLIPGEVLVGLRAEADVRLSANAFSAFGQVAGQQNALHARRIRLRTGVSIEAALAQLRRRSDVQFAEPNHVRSIATLPLIPNDPYYGNQYAPQLVQADAAWSLWQPRKQIVIAIVDTGVDGTHPDLTNKILRDSGGIMGYDALTGQRDDAADGYGHGTHCAGIAAAEVNNNIGIAGIAGWNGQANFTNAGDIKIMPVKVLDATGNGSDASVSDGMVWAVDHGANVISLSLGGSDTSATLDAAVKYATDKNVLVVAAAGNNGSSSKFYPAASPGALPVAATDSGDTLASFSNYGDWVKVAAPGVAIISTLPVAGSKFGMANYGTLSGTSMATPHVAGEAAFLLAQNPNLTPAQLQDIITKSVDPYTPYGVGSKNSHSIVAGAGRINVLKALQAVPAIATPVYRINAGGAAKTPFAADNFYTGTTRTLGSSASTTVDTSGVANAAPAGVYLTERYGYTPFTYTFANLTPGYYYTVRLHWAELYYTKPGKTFNVAVNGSNVLTAFDIVATAGGGKKAVVRDFVAIADLNGKIAVTFTVVKGDASINGLEILK